MIVIHTIQIMLETDHVVQRSRSPPTAAEIRVQSSPETQIFCGQRLQGWALQPIQADGQGSLNCSLVWPTQDPRGSPVRSSNIGKSGNPQFKSAPPQLRNLRTTKLIAELWTKKSCGTAVAGLENLTPAIPQLSTVSCKFCYFLVPFPQLRMVLKSTQNIFKTVCFSGNQKTCLKWTVT